MRKKIRWGEAAGREKFEMPKLGGVSLIKARVTKENECKGGPCPEADHEQRPA